ncbi:molybdopterin molybdenumtransferase MoeA [Halobiforma lacisalsi AJ5]|uniref:Molybdenum cofactor synthesis protein n=1 Tax=Natronobacterium lacisalsi AJ5 TaxID=358396 RepID=M0LM91_NATLA|nr:molybdopterin molybdotransferase MoeA [Halobiforma lacisalsi]APW96911.1 molybdopterin molybdenumtransferase MoeA [Halobiforma lacisalsi AJ5]EMA34621.1 molybdenum cofactor synthesis protein [Halobiforma lacisalsi AJ5]
MSDDENDDRDDHSHADLLSLEDAIDRSLARRDALLEDRPATTVPLERIAGRILAEDVVADADRPATDRATMDGYAYAAADAEAGPLEVVDPAVYPESEPPALEPGQAVEIATGAPLPERADTVVKREDAVLEDGRLDGPDLAPGTYVYERGSNLAAGERLYAAGDRLDAADAILLRDLGRESVAVADPLSIGVQATGTEIHEGKHTDLDSPMLCNLLRAWGHDPDYEGSVPDEGDRVRERIDDLAGDHDVVVTTGGTSVGEKDHVIDALASLGEVDFHRVRLRPGKPIAIASLPDHDAVAVAVPGKPIGAYVSTALVARPLFTGERRPATLERTFGADVGLGPAGFTYAIPVTLDPDGKEANPLGHADSPLSVYEETFDPSVLSSSTRAASADGFVLTTDPLEAGERVDVVPTTALE